MLACLPMRLPAPQKQHRRQRQPATRSQPPVSTCTHQDKVHRVCRSVRNVHLKVLSIKQCTPSAAVRDSAQHVGRTCSHNHAAHARASAVKPRIMELCKGARQNKMLSECDDRVSLTVQLLRRSHCSGRCASDRHTRLAHPRHWRAPR